MTDDDAEVCRGTAIRAVGSRAQPTAEHGNRLDRRIDLGGLGRRRLPSLFTVEPVAGSRTLMSLSTLSGSSNETQEKRAGREGLLFQVFRAKYAVAAGLDNDGTLPRREKVWHIRRNDYEAASGIGLQLCLVEPFPNPQVPCAFDHGDDFVIRMSMGEDAAATGEFHPVDPVSAFARIAAKVRPLSAVGVVGGSEPSNVLRRQRG